MVAKTTSLISKTLWVVAVIVAGYVVLRSFEEPVPTPHPSVSVAPIVTPTVAVISPQPTIAGVADEYAIVERVIDGDTVVLVGGRRVRYIGIDTPESVQVGKPVECLGKESAEKNRLLVEGKQVRLQKDVSETDRLGRLLRYIYVDDVFVNDVLVREGFAKSSRYPPDIAEQATLEEAEQFARQMKWGIWSGQCGQVVKPTSLSVSSSGCDIKGNISGGEKIYHTPGCGSFARTEISPDKGERYFCSEEEAQAAGWRRAQNC